MVLFVHLASVNNLVKLGFQNQIQPNSSTASVSFSKGMHSIHFHILLDDLIKSGLRHLVNVLNRRLQIHHRCKTEVALCDIDGSQLAGKVINFTEKVFVNRFECRELSGFK